MHKTVPELVDDFVRGSDAAFTELVHRYQRKVYSLAYQVLGNHLDADEVVQETFVRIYRRRKELAEVKFFSTFLLRIASNYAIDVLRKQRGHSRMPEDSSSLPGEVQIDLARQVATPSEEFENRALLEEIKRALRELPPRQQQIGRAHV